MPQRRDSYAGVSYTDVEQAVRAVQREFNCNVEFAASMPVVEGTAVLFWWVATATPRWVGKQTIRAKVAKQRAWPTVEHQTLAGLLLHLVYELHATLDKQGVVASQAALFD